MAKFYVKMSVDFCGEIEADSEAHAEELAWTSWGDTADSEIGYDGVNSIKVEALEDDEEDEEEEE